MKVQAYLDGELSEREARRVAEELRSEPEAQALLAELRNTTSALRENEPTVALPESREFFWGKIEREITRAEAAPERAGVPIWALLRRYMAPFAGAALVVFLGVLSLNRSPNTATEDQFLHHLAEVENLSDHMSSWSYRSHSDNMFIVWVSEKSENLAPLTDESDPEAMED